MNWRKIGGLGVAVWMVGALVGCSHYVAPGRGANMGAVGMPELRRAQTDPDMRAAFDRKPLAKFPASIAVVRVQSPGYRSLTAESFGQGAYSIVTTRDIEKDDQMERLAKLPEVAGIASIGRLTLMPMPELNSNEPLRRVAAQLQADMVLIYTIDTAFYVRDMATPLSVVTLGLSPSQEARVTTTASAILIDTRSGYVYGTAEATQRSNQLASAWTSADAVDAARLRTESKAFEKLVGELEKTWVGIARRDAPATQPSARVPSSIGEHEQPAPVYAMTDGAEPPAEERDAAGDKSKRYVLIGPMSQTEPKEGYRLLVVLPGGDGSAAFRPFVTRIAAQALSGDFLIAQLVAPKWDARQQIVWPTEKSRVAKMEFTTEQFIDAVVAEVSQSKKIDKRRVFALGWSSSGPAVYSAAMRARTPIAGAFVAMSVFKPLDLPPARNAKGRAFYILHSPQDFIPMRLAENATLVLSKAGAKVTLATYRGGHGWHSDVFGEIHQGVRWLEANVAGSQATSEPVE